jgi:hypothetical protein
VEREVVAPRGGKGIHERRAKSASAKEKSAKENATKRDSAEVPDADQLYGILQFTCGIPAPEIPAAGESASSRAITSSDVKWRRGALCSWFLPPAGGFQFCGLTEIISGHPAEPPPHTWLLQLSRHAALGLRGYYPRLPGAPLPDGFPAVLDWHSPNWGGNPPWRHYLRVQRARDDGSRRLTSETDCNDYLIRRPEPPESASAEPAPEDEDRSLRELQLFFCEFLAQRRGAIFASHVSERIYNIWLPPGIVTRHDQRRDQTPAFAVLPVVTVVRRPYRIDWRYAMSLSMIFVPWPAGAGEVPAAVRPRSMSAREIVDVLASTGGNSTYLREPADIRWTMSARTPLAAYLAAVTSDDRREFGSRYPGRADPAWCERPVALRHWIELLLLTAAERPAGQDERDESRKQRERQQADDQILPDEVLRCLRVNGFWSAVLVTDSFKACAGSSRIEGGRWWPDSAGPCPDTVNALAAGVPVRIAEVFGLFAQRDRAFLPTPQDRVDLLATGGRSHLTWRIPSEHIMITAYSRETDDFPSFSSLNLAGWFAYMALGVTCAWQTMYSLTHDTDKLRDIAKLSQLGHDRIMDLEDVYDLDVAWPAYADFYRRVRELLGVDQEYNQIKDRLELLFRFAQVEQQTREERQRYEEIQLRNEEQQIASRRSHLVENAAATIGAGILIVSVLILLVETRYDKMLTTLTAGACLLGFLASCFVGGIVLRSKLRANDAGRKKVQEQIARLAHPAPTRKDH